jgi:hypothetical protein
MERENISMNRQETRAQMSGANLSGPPDLRVLNDGMAERQFAEQVETDPLRSELKPGGMS